jgi:dipeptidyl aminopeptidase/acylaminoacyl peptidase
MSGCLRTAGLSAALLLFAATAPAAEKRPMKTEDLYKFKRVASPQVSPDGKHVAYQVTTVSLDENTSTSAIFIAATDGKTAPRQLADPKGKKDTNPRWAPNGQAILFESTRTGTPQLWLFSLAGGEPIQMTTLHTGASNGIWSPDGSHVAFNSAVYPEYSQKPFAESDRLNKQKDEELEKNPVKAKVFTKLFYRHWDEYVGDKRQHLFVIGSDGKDCRDVTPGDRDAYPTSDTFSSGEDFTFSPDSRFLVFTAVPEKDEAWSTNYDMCRVSIRNTSTKWEPLTADNKGADSGPRFVKYGRGEPSYRLVWRTQKKPGFEADRWDLVQAVCKPDGSISGEVKPVTDPDRDQSVNDFCFLDNRFQWYFYAADYRGTVSLFCCLEKGAGSDKPRLAKGFSSSPSGAAGTVAFLHAELNRPAEVFVASFNGLDLSKPINISRANESLLSELDLPRPESVEVPVEGDVKMQMWVLKPPGFDPAKKWPVAFLVHGGPQSAWNDNWSYRWNASLWAAQGYVVVLPNPRGSTGFGQKYVEEISGDWGGKCYRDLVAGLDHVVSLPYVDKDRIGAAGASFGGYMMDWFAVNDISKRFKCLISHCSVWNFESEWGTTDELWFDEHDHGGLPWQIPGKYREFSPHTKAGNLGKYKTPMLVIQNDLDFRCPIGQGHELFSALQRQGVPSRFVNFPDEGHWVLKPKNSAYWHKEVFGWLTKYVPPGPG